MQQIGLFMVVLPNADQSSYLEPFWCYLVYDDRVRTWSMKTAPVSESGVVPDWDSPELSVQAVPEKIHVVGYEKQARYGQEWTWVTECMAVKGGAIFVYPSMTDVSRCVSYNVSGQKYLEILTPDALGMSSSDFNYSVSIDRAKLKYQYTTWRKAKLESLPKAFLHYLSLYEDVTTSIAGRVQALTQACYFLSNWESSVYISVPQLLFNGTHFALENHLNQGVVTLLNGLSHEEFQYTVDVLLQIGWSSHNPVAFYVYLLQELNPEKAYELVKRQAIQAQLAVLFSQSDLKVDLFAGCAEETRKIILAIPEVNNVLKDSIKSVDSLVALSWSHPSRLTSRPDVNNKKDAIVEAIGIDVVKTWVTDLNSLNRLRGCTTLAMFSQLIWDKPALLAQGVRSPNKVESAIEMLFANPTRSPLEIQQKITEFVNELPEKNDRSWSTNASPYSDVITSGKLTAAQKIDLFKIPSIYEAITGDTFTWLMQSGCSTPEKELFFQALFPEKIKQFILQTNGGVLRTMSPAQKVQARTAFSAEALQQRPYLFLGVSDEAELSRDASNRDIQPTLFLRIMTHRATPYVGAMLLLAGVALLMMTSHVVLGASLVVTGGLTLFGSYMNRVGRNPKPEGDLAASLRV